MGELSVPGLKKSVQVLGDLAVTVKVGREDPDPAPPVQHLAPNPAIPAVGQGDSLHPANSGKPSGTEPTDLPGGTKVHLARISYGLRAGFQLTNRDVLLGAVHCGSPAQADRVSANGAGAELNLGAAGAKIINFLNKPVTWVECRFHCQASEPGNSFLKYDRGCKSLT